MSIASVASGSALAESTGASTGGLSQCDSATHGPAADQRRIFTERNARALATVCTACAQTAATTDRFDGRRDWSWSARSREHGCVAAVTPDCADSNGIPAASPGTEGLWTRAAAGAWRIRDWIRAGPRAPVAADSSTHEIGIATGATYAATRARLSTRASRRLDRRGVWSCEATVSSIAAVAVRLSAISTEPTPATRRGPDVPRIRRTRRHDGFLARSAVAAILSGFSRQSSLTFGSRHGYGLGKRRRGIQ
jgi:hypothetical protein